jgi:hypothetical protein
VHHRLAGPHVGNDHLRGETVGRRWGDSGCHM